MEVIMNFVRKSIFLTLIAAAVILWLTPCSAFPQVKSGLHEAATKGDLTTMQRLLAEGADINGRNGTDATPLIAAIVEGQKEAAKFLIVKGADIDAKFLGRWSPLVIASVAGQAEIVDILLKKGADKTNMEMDIDELTKEKATNERSGQKAQMEHLKATLKQAYMSAQIYFLNHPGSIIANQEQLAEAGWTTIPKDIIFVRADLSETAGGIVLKNKKLDKTNSIEAKNLWQGEGMINFAGDIYLPSLK